MAKKGNAAQKKQQKQQRQDNKSDKISKKAGKIYGNDDIDQILKDFAEQDKKKSTVQVEVVENIPPRINGSLVAHPVDNYIWMHGGEHFNGLKCTTYNDSFLYNCDKNQYKQYTIPKSPLRSGHSSVIVPQDNTSYLYTFFGDFTSPSQLFKHFNDIWILNLSDHTWEQLTVTGGPEKRSGHRIALCKRAIYVFGGFYDNHQSIKYFNDLWKFDLDTRTWTKLGPGAQVTGKKAANMTAQEIAAANNALWPTPRSGCGFCYHEGTNSLMLYGGYCTVQQKNTIEENANVLSDLWSYSLTTNSWTQQKQSNGPATPHGRAACTLFTYASHLLCFGGVSDVEKKIEKKNGKVVKTIVGKDGQQQQQPEGEPQDGAEPEEQDEEEEEEEEEVVNTNKNKKNNKKAKKGKKGGKQDDDDDNYIIESEFYNELLEYSFKHKRWFKLNVNVGKLGGGKADAAVDDEDEKELLNDDDVGGKKPTAAAAPNASWGYMSSAKLQQEKLKEQQRMLTQRRKQLELEQEQALLKLVEDNKAEEKDDDDVKDDKKKILPVTYLWPRRNAHVTVKNGVVFLYGGAFERDNIEVILNDFHSLDLKKVFKNTDLDKDNAAYVAAQQQANGAKEVILKDPTAADYAGSWMCITEPDLDKFNWFGNDDDDDGDEEEEYGYDSDDDDDDDDGEEDDEEKEKKTRVPSIEGFATGKEYFKSCEAFWISEALTEAPEDSTDKELRLFGFKLAKKYFEMMKKKDE